MSAHRRHQIFATVLIVLLPILSGCASAPKKQEVETPLEGPAKIPIPAGFQQIDKESVLIAFGGFQAGLAVYEGDREPSLVVGFYQEMLPPRGWTLVASFISKDSILVYTKEHQACVISVFRNRPSTRLEVRVGISEPLTKSSSP